MRFSLLRLAPRCTVLCSRWCQNGVNFTLTPSCEWYGSTSVMVGATVSGLIVSVLMLTLPVFRPWRVIMRRSDLQYKAQDVTLLIFPTYQLGGLN
jgi:hypothetical protein